MRLYNSKRPEMVAVYGRRRVGKTYLIEELFRDKFAFRHAGLSPLELKGTGQLKDQLEQFYYSLLMHGMKKSHRPESWLEAFFMLEMFLQEKDDGSRQVVFIDELPWMDTPRSGFLTAFEGFWNNWGCHRKNLMLIVCGSASSWIQDKLINNYGGLYGRVTYEIKLAPFDLYECEAFFQENNVGLSRYDIAQSYMTVGGIPYYLGYIEQGRSFSQNIDRMFFAKNARLKDEFDKLFNSLFNNSDAMKELIELLSTRNSGYTRREITEKCSAANGGRLSERLEALEKSDFIEKYIPFGSGKRDERYRLTDPFCLFYLRFVRNKEVTDEHFWQNSQDSQSVVVWRGIAFENLCFNHIDQIKRALGISGVSTMHSSWNKKSDEGDGTQIDMIISRRDNVVNMCEIKFYSDLFVVDKNYELHLRHRRTMLSEIISRKSTIHATLITTYGIKENEYRWSFDNVITMDDLFENN